MKNSLKLFLFAILFSIILQSCSASTGDRYEKDEVKTTEKKEIPKETNQTDFEEDFNLVPYRTEINIEYEEGKLEPLDNVDIWYQYDDADTVEFNGEIISNAEGYRVQVLATDNLDEANKLKTELYFKTNQKNVYIIFDPPFYKVKVGDFSDIANANTLSFKLSQMGYSDSRVVKDTINIYE